MITSSIISIISAVWCILYYVFYSRAFKNSIQILNLTNLMFIFLYAHFEFDGSNAYKKKLRHWFDYP